MRAILKKDKRALAEQWEEPQQYIEVVGVVIDVGLIALSATVTSHITDMGHNRVSEMHLCV